MSLEQAYFSRGAPLHLGPFVIATKHNFRMTTKHGVPCPMGDQLWVLGTRPGRGEK